MFLKQLDQFKLQYYSFKAESMLRTLAIHVTSQVATATSGNFLSSYFTIHGEMKNMATTKFATKFRCHETTAILFCASSVSTFQNLYFRQIFKKEIWESIFLA